MPSLVLATLAIDAGTPLGRALPSSSRIATAFTILAARAVVAQVWTVTDGASTCRLSDDGLCVTNRLASGANYGSYERCTVRAEVRLSVNATEFETEIGTYDYDDVMPARATPATAAGCSLAGQAVRRLATVSAGTVTWDPFARFAIAIGTSNKMASAPLAI